jgi:hypothetical protein
MPQAKSPKKHSPDHYTAIKKLRYASELVMLTLLVLAIAQLISSLLGYGLFVKEPTWYDYLNAIVLVMAAGTTVTLMSKLESVDIKRRVKSSASLWFIAFALYLGYFQSRAELDSWKALGLVYLGGMASLLYVISSHMDNPATPTKDDPDPEGIL